MAFTADAGAKRPLRSASTWRRYGYLWVTAALFLVSLVGHWWLG